MIVTYNKEQVGDVLMLTLMFVNVPTLLVKGKLSQPAHRKKS